MNGNGKKRFDLIHPVTGKIDTLGALQFVINELAKEPDLVKGNAFSTLKGSMSDRLKKFGFEGHPEVTLLMQELGLLHHYGAHTTTVWVMVNPEHFNELVSEEWLARATHNAEKHAKTVNDLRITGEKLERLEKGGAGKVGKGGESAPKDAPETVELEQMAEMASMVEQLGDTLAARDKRIEELEKELAASKPDSRAVAEELLQRARDKLAGAVRK